MYKKNILSRTDTADSWSFANSDVIPATGIMVFGMSLMIMFSYLFLSEC